MQAREQGGAFRDIFDFCERVGKEHVNKRTIESLIRAGAFDALEPNRAMLLANVDLAVNHAEQQSAFANQSGLFDDAHDAIEAVQMVAVPMWNESTQLAEEKQVIGFYLSGHPFHPYQQEVRQIAPVRLNRLRPQESVRVAGFVTAVRTMMGKRGKLAFVTLEDTSGKVEALVTGEVLEAASSILKSDQVLLLECRINRDDYNGGNGLRIIANSVMTLPQARERFARSLTLYLNQQHDMAAVMALLHAHRHSANASVAPLPLRVFYRNPHAQGELNVQQTWQLVSSVDLFNQLSTLLGEQGLVVGW